MSMGSIFSIRSFQFYWASLAISQTGSFFSMVAMPWLGLALGHDNPVVVTTLLAIGSLPSSLFILFGGGLADRYSPFSIFLVSRAAIFLVIGSLAVLTVLQRIPLPLLYVYVAVLGTLGAIGIPASQSLLPFIVRSEQLGLANGVVMATMQASQMVAPLAAGWMIWFCRRSRGIVEGGPDLVSIGLALGVDAIAAASAALLVLYIKRHPAPHRSEKLFDLLQQGLSFCWREKNIRRVLSYVMLISFFVQGPLLASLPLIAKFQLGLQERGYGTLYAMLGAGTIAGAGLAILLKPSAQKLGMVVLFCDLMIGLCLYNLGQVHSAGLAASILFLIGNGLGVTMVAGTTWFQTRTPGKYMGRVMSFLMFAVIGLIPLSAILTGFLVSFMSVTRILNVAGGVTILFTITGLLIPSIRRMGDIPEAAFNEEKSPALTLEHREIRDALPSTIG